MSLYKLLKIILLDLNFGLIYFKWNKIWDYGLKYFGLGLSKLIQLNETNIQLYYKILRLKLLIFYFTYLQ